MHIRKLPDVSWHGRPTDDRSVLACRSLRTHTLESGSRGDWYSGKDAGRVFIRATLYQCEIKNEGDAIAKDMTALQVWSISVRSEHDLQS